MLTAILGFAFLSFLAIFFETGAQHDFPSSLRRTEEFQNRLKNRDNIDIDPAWLERFLRPFAGKQCYVILRNALNLDFVQRTVPLLTQYFEPMYESDTTCDYSCAFWIASKFHSKQYFNGTVVVLENRKCESRFFLNDIDIRRGSGGSFCVLVNVTKWIMSGRPGNCKIVIDYALPSYIIENDMYGYPHSEDSWSRWTPLTLQINVLVQVVAYNVEPEHHESFENSTLIPNWAVTASKLHSYQSLYSTVSVYFLVIVRYGSWDMVHTNEVAHTIYKLKPFEFRPILVESRGWKEMEEVDLKSVQYDDEDTVWEIRLWWHVKLSESLNYCSSYARLRARQGKGSVEERAARKADADAHILQLIMGNFTYDTGNGSLCKYPGVIVQGSFETGAHIIAAYEAIPTLIFNSSLRDTRFVACGNRGSSQLAFDQLFRVFEYRVWVGWSVACLVMSALILQMQNTTSWEIYGTSAIQVFKVFLEQGNPFSGAWISSNRSRLIVIATMLAGTVLSSAYKSTNLYMMTQPRKLLTYDTLDQLQRDNDTMYSRLGTVQIYIGHSTVYWETPYFVLSTDDAGETVDDDGEQYYIHYKLESIQYESGRYIIDDKHQNAINLFPSSIKTLMKMVDDFIRLNYSSPEMYTNLLQSNYTDWEEQKLVDLLRSCSRGAVFLPENIAVKYAKILQHFHPTQISISKQSLYKDAAGIKFSGLISRALLARVALIKQAGILLKWENLFNFDLDTELSLQREQVSAVRLNGNVIIHFTLLLAGCFLACATFVFEKRNFLI